jgi:hypothetical protein
MHGVRPDTRYTRRASLTVTGAGSADMAAYHKATTEGISIICHTGTVLLTCRNVAVLGETE